jgi:hypothetical protein
MLWCMSCPIRVRRAEAYLVVGEGVCLRHDGGGVWRLPGVVEAIEVVQWTWA